MATLGSLAIGTDVCDPFFNGRNKDSSNVIWRILEHNHDGSNTTTLVCRNLGTEGTRVNCEFDEPETSNPDDAIRANGNNRYDLSNVFQWLNSEAESNWFTPTHEYDVAPTFYKASETGFLYPFSSEFKNALISTTKPYRRYGESTTRNISGKVHLLSYSEITGQSYDGVSDGNQYALLNQGFAKASSYESAQSIMGLRSYEVSRTPSTNSKTENVSTIRKLNNGSFSSNNSRASYNIYNGFIITLPSSTKVSSDKYKYGSYEVYAMFNMPLHIEVDNGVSAKTVNLNDGETYSLKIKVFDEDYSVNSLIVSFNSDGSNPLKTWTNPQKKTEYTFTGNIRDLVKGSAKKLYFIATDSNGRTTTKVVSVTWGDAMPIISVFKDGEWTSDTNIGNLGTVTKPLSLKLKFHDADDVDGFQNIYGSFYRGSIFSGYIENVPTTPHDTEIDFVVSDDAWRSIADGQDGFGILASPDEYSPERGGYNGSYIGFIMTKATPAPYIDIESTSLGRKNVGFIVKYTPKIDTIQTITNLKIYLDDTETVLVDMDNPTPDVELSYEITKSALYNMTIGTHSLIFVLTDDLGQSGTTNVTFTRYNDAPNVITEGSLGNKNLGFTSNFTVQDSEGDISSVNVYIDSVDSTPIKSETNVTTGTQITYEVTKAMLYNLALGSHTIIIVASDVVGSSTTNVSFVRTNSAPTINGNNDLGNVNQPFTETVTVGDAENDTTQVKFYLDNATEPFHTETITEQSDITYSITRDMLDDLSLSSHVIDIVAKDSENQQTTFTVTFTHYNVSPSVVMTQDEVIHNGDFEVEYTVSDTDSEEAYVVFRIDGNIVVNSQRVSVGEMHTQVIPLANIAFGNHTLVIQASDKWTAMTPSEASVNFTYNSLPTIDADDVGKVVDGFVEPITVTDTDLDSVDVEVFIDDTLKIAEINNIQHGIPVNVTVSGVTFGSLTYGRHYINIYAKDSHNQTAIRNVSFEKHSKPTVSIDSQIPQEVTDAFSVTISYDNADGGELTIKAYIDEQEIEQ